MLFQDITPVVLIPILAIGCSDDLFHSTRWQGICEINPADSQCVNEAGTVDAEADAPVPDALHEETAAPCPAGLSLCGEECFDLENDADNCGACGRSCRGDSCEGRLCAVVALATGVTEPSDLAVGPTEVYWTRGPSANGAILSVPLAGGDVQTLATGEGEALVLVRSENSLYWITFSAVLTLNLEDNQAVPLIAAPVWYGLAVDDSHVYWTEADRVRRIGKSGGSAMDFATGEAPYRLAVNQDAVFWVDQAEQASVRMKSKSGGQAVTLTESASWPDEIAADDQYVYWADCGQKRIMSAAISDGDSVELAVEQSGLGALAIDDERVYWARKDKDTWQGAVVAVPKQGGEPVVLVRDRLSVLNVAVDDNSVYWIERGDGESVGALYRVAK